MTTTVSGVGFVRAGGRSHDRFNAQIRQSGAALIELALALPLLVMLIGGMVSAGIAYNHQLALTHSAREAGRYAATLPVTGFASMEAWLDSVAQRALDDAAGSLNPGASGYYVCVAYVHPGGVIATDSTKNRVDDGVSVTYAKPLPGVTDGSCVADGRPNGERRVQISVARETDFDVVFFSSAVTLDAEAVNRFEAILGF